MCTTLCVCMSLLYILLLLASMHILHCSPALKSTYLHLPGGVVIGWQRGAGVGRFVGQRGGERLLWGASCVVVVAAPGRVLSSSMAQHRTPHLLSVAVQASLLQLVLTICDRRWCAAVRNVQ